MAKTYSDLFAEVRDSVKIISLEDLKARLESGDEPVLVDVREKDEFRQGYIPGAVHIPRGFLEMQAEQKLPDKNAKHRRLLRGRHALAPSPPKTLQELGYTQRRVAPTPASCAGRTWATRSRAAAAHRGAARALLAAPAPARGRREGAGEAAEGARAAARRGRARRRRRRSTWRRRASARSGIVDADVVDASNLQRQILHGTVAVGMPKVESAETASADLNPDVKVVTFQERLPARTSTASSIRAGT